MTLNVKDPRARQLAQAVAQASGESMTTAVIRALEERLERLHGGRRDAPALADDLRAIARRAAAHVRRPYAEHAEWLYDEHGLPK